MKKRLFALTLALLALLPGIAGDIDGLRIMKRDSILTQITGATIPEKELTITSFGAKGDDADAKIEKLRNQFIK